MRLLAYFTALLALAGCSASSLPDPSLPRAVGFEAAPVAGYPIEVSGSRMTTVVRLPPGPCQTVAVPLQGAREFEIAMWRAVAGTNATAVRRVEVAGRGITPRLLASRAGGLTLQLVAAAELMVLPTVGGRVDVELQAIGAAPLSVGRAVACDAIASAVTEAYRDALRGLGGQLAQRVRSASGAPNPSRLLGP